MEHCIGCHVELTNGLDTFGEPGYAFCQTCFWAWLDDPRHRHLRDLRNDQARQRQAIDNLYVDHLMADDDDDEDIVDQIWDLEDLEEWTIRRIADLEAELYPWRYQTFDEVLVVLPVAAGVGK